MCEIIPSFEYKWTEKYHLEDDNYILTYYSVLLNFVPIYRLFFKKSKLSYQIYKLHDNWKISDSYVNYNNFIDFSERKTLHDLIPPIDGWNLKIIQEAMFSMISKYHFQISKNHKIYDYFKINYFNHLDERGRKIIASFLFSVKNYKVRLPLEMSLMIFSNLRIINLNY